MQTNIRKLSTVALIALLTISLIPALALPQMPHQFYGTVTMGGVAAPDGVSVDAKIDGVTYLSTTTLGGKYGYAPLFKVPADDPDVVGVEGGVAGDTVEFYVGGVLATPTYIFENGIATNLPLVAVGGPALTGTLSVTTTPVNGEVFVDDVSKGTAPQDIVVPVGAHTVSYGPMTGYTTPDPVLVTVDADETEVLEGIYVLIPAGDTGTLSVDTTPVKGEVFVDGVSWGVAPKSKVLAVGSYTVSYGAFEGYTTPSPVLAIVTKDAVTTKMGTYVLKTVTPTESGFTAENIDIKNDNKPAWDDCGEKGHTIILEGDSGSVASGYEVSVYWNRIQDWDGVKGHLNTTESDNDGGFEIWIKVPEAKEGDQTLWFTATDQETKVSKTFTVIPDCDISTASGLAGSKIYVDLWGFAKNKDVAILFIDDLADLDSFGVLVSLEDLEETVDTDEDDYDGTLEKEMIVPGTFVLHIGTDTFDDNSKGKLYSAYAESCGSINYVTGEWSIDLGDTAATETGAFKADYKYFKDSEDHFYVITATGVTNDLGTWEDKRITIPDDADEKKYYIVGMDGKNNQANAAFTIGATITLSVDEGPVGTKVEVTGEGFPFNVEVTCEIWRNDVKVEDVHIIGSKDTTGADDDETDDDGEFEFDIIIPQVKKKDDDYEIKVLATGTEAAADFEVTGLAEISAEPGFGPQGSSTTVSGENFQNIKDKKVKITLVRKGIELADIKTSVKVDSDGSFEAKCTIPTENDGPYKIKVESKADDDGDFYISDTVDFRIGTIMVLLSKDESVVGDKIVMTGNGFTDDGEWNATFGDIPIFSEEQASGTGLLRVGSDTPQFFVPQVQPGEYTILVWDVDAELTVETDFTVTNYTVLDFELLEAPNEFNVSIDGWNWPEVDGDVNDEDEIIFVLFNETDDWDMDVRQEGTPGTVAVLNATGFLNDAWWVVPDDEVLDKGTYTVNATIETDNDQEYIMQLEFVISDVHKDISPRKTTFRILDTVSFDIQHTFGNDANQPIKGGDVKVYDPDGTLYWDGDPLKTWSKFGTWYEVPNSAQTASGNPMVLLDDAPLGTWTYKWREDDGDTIMEGTFNVEASEADILVGQIKDINQAIADLTDDIIGVSDSVTGLQTNINSAVQAAQAAVEASQAAIDAVNAGTALSGEALEAADRAAEAAGKAQDAASSLTTLVYGAIGASLVAALAAIVSLMQISRRIAG